ncbi:hypothetical protein PCANC_06531 [Puccinia coronata f. sp. avenae]|uniref:Uncharacterized protein n=1 Tax=Puccinia coronata f. sp. avenae TaxID=200324 RepID=A0A2N5VAD1_9BASI|nr:hypothetical protein PCASD_22357 [Puccinia coronata f. sp. avenae]PLW46960.1 hypothetical protein PCANC_06531 [Puccinia coronata f. sp. avenae]PLW47175.1 hypothetical protein PCASD_02350 [Puccinia coronata f. sp. avenae]
MVDPHWHAVGSWLPTLLGTWTSLVLASQSWQLYQDQKAASFEPPRNSLDLMVLKRNDPHCHHETQLESQNHDIQLESQKGDQK